MKFAVISDIHANATALRFVLDSIREQRVEKIYCLGDVVGFHTSPGECIDLLQHHRIECIAGNHDAGVVGSMKEEQFPRECWEAILWTRRNISEGQLKFLQALQSQKVVDKKFWLMLGIFGDPYHYMTGGWTHQYAFLRLQLAGIRFAFYGHIHRQTCFKSPRRMVPREISSVEAEGSVPLDGNSIYLINPGTIGQPRNNESDAKFALVDLGIGSIMFKRIPYDYSTVLRRTLEVFPSHASMYRRFGTMPATAPAK